MENIRVSVICNAFNHAPYIRDALEGFVMQKTTFPFEVLIHDDASADGTAEIIREYEEKYPDLIKPIYQTENQYSKGVKIAKTYQIPRAKGDYVAYCEGDDYWTDENKLQKQFDALEAHPEIDICAHGAKRITPNSSKQLKDCAPAKNDKVFSPEEVIRGGGGFVATASLFFRTKLLKEMPPFRAFLMLDYTLQIHGSLRGGLLYLKDIMSVYRYHVPGSWTMTHIKSDEKQTQHFHQKMQMFALLDEDTNGKYKTAVEHCKLQTEMSHYISMGQPKKAMDPKFKSIRRSYPLLWNLKLRIKVLSPLLTKALRNHHKNS